MPERKRVKTRMQKPNRTMLALNQTSEKNLPLLLDAISRTRQIEGTPIFNSTSYAEYQTRDYVMMVKERD